MKDAIFDRGDIWLAHLMIEIDYNVNGIVWERKSNARRNMSTGVQLHRMGYQNIYADIDFSMNKNAQAIYAILEKRYGFVK